MDTPLAPENLHELRILEQIEQDPEATQSDLAARMGVAVGTVNWYVKRLVKKGHIKVTRLQRRRLRYLITPDGIAEKTRLAMEYVRVSMGMYRATRQQARELLVKAREAGSLYCPRSPPRNRRKSAVVTDASVGLSSLRHRCASK